ncbi:hypothetical protein SDC9_106226 [bioreactor metagenome]|uniref:Uncharacterized protein n=1 Tax=bioreactor metagenome TaxID=1076179 RepID=A0A645BCE9_9ZZZZ
MQRSPGEQPGLRFVLPSCSAPLFTASANEKQQIIRGIAVLYCNFKNGAGAPRKQVANGFAAQPRGSIKEYHSEKL